MALMAERLAARSPFHNLRRPRPEDDLLGPAEGVEESRQSGSVLLQVETRKYG
jgi:hypothetical protein